MGGIDRLFDRLREEPEATGVVAGEGWSRRYRSLCCQAHVIRLSSFSVKLLHEKLLSQHRSVGPAAADRAERKGA